MLLCCTPETTIILYVNCNSINKSNKYKKKELDLIIHYKNLQSLAKLLYSWLQFTTAKDTD